jgi:hypothetical protein
MSNFKPSAKIALAACAATLAFTGPALAKQPKPTSYLRGDIHKGEYVSRLYRGPVVPDELTVLPTPQNCQGYMDAHVSWNQEENWVKLHLTGKNVLVPHPSVDRTEGVNWWPNKFQPEPVDYDNGRYQFWFIILDTPIEFYYDLATLDLLGSEYEIAEPPLGSITLHLPIGSALGTDFIQPDQNGDVDFTQVFAYDKMVRGDLPSHAHVAATYIPHNLCTAHPFRYELTSTRPWANARPASEGRPFSDYLRAGMFFDLTVEPPEYFVFPPLNTGVATYSQNPAVGGEIPPGWSLDIEAVFANLAPPIRPFPGAGSCEAWTRPKRDRNFNQCIGH